MVVVAQTSQMHLATSMNLATLQAHHTFALLVTPFLITGAAGLLTHGTGQTLWCYPLEPNRTQCLGAITGVATESSINSEPCPKLGFPFLLQANHPMSQLFHEVHKGGGDK